MRPRRVRVKWIDSSKITQPWTSVGELRRMDDEADYITSVGYLVKRTRRLLVLCNDLHHEGGKGVVAYGGVFLIPRGCVLKMRRLKG